MTISPVQNNPNTNSIVPSPSVNNNNNSNGITSVQTNTTTGTASIPITAYQLPPLTKSNNHSLSSNYTLNVTATATTTTTGPTTSTPSITSSTTNTINDHNFRNSTVSPPFNNHNTVQQQRSAISETISNNDNSTNKYHESIQKKPSNFPTMINTRPLLSPFSNNNNSNNNKEMNNIPPPLQQLQQQQPATSSISPSDNNSSSNSGGRPLNVKDALSYLDQVKVRFSERPEVYNQFLDIMKDFKSQTIDTPGVIERVSTLFRGHPNLTSGFNAFLPPGYNIYNDPKNPDIIRVTTPTGPMTLNHNNTNDIYNNSAPHHQLPHPLLNKAPSNPIYYGSNYNAPPPLSSGPPPTSIHQNNPFTNSAYQYQPPSHENKINANSEQIVSSNNNNTSSLYHSHQQQQYHTQYQYSQQQQQQQYYNNQQPVIDQRPTIDQQNPTSYQSPPSISSQPTTTTNNNNNKSTKGKRPAVDFNNAITYVNKIKNRFTHDSDIYKQFLELLQTYQKDERRIDEVYSQVQLLFQGHPDLLDEFHQFLPEVVEGRGNKRSLENNAAISSTLPAGKKKRQGLKRNKHSVDSNNYEDNDQYTRLDGPSTYNTNNTNNNSSSQVFDPKNPMVSAEEIELFDHIHKHIGNKPSYEVFLKLLNLYSQDIIDLDELVKRVNTFLGSKPELMIWFKAVIGYDSSTSSTPTVERPTTSIQKPDLVRCETVNDSPSYRRVPKEWQYQPCSGRDSLCWEVLNDEYASHPIWASEDSGYATAKKNIYEEYMHRCEEERYEYDVNIEANLNTIALLEPIEKELESMPVEEQEHFKLSPGLGGQSISIYERTLKKIYGTERGAEVIEMIYSEPARTIPIIMKRLKQKDEEWSKAQREWNKAWRESDEKNYYKSLDYQGLTFKSSERKTVTNRYLLNEIESLYQHDDNENEKDKDHHHHSIQNDEQKSNHSTPSLTTIPHLSYQISDVEIFDDILYLINIYMDHQNGFSSNDKNRVQKFFKSFVPAFFNMNDAHFILGNKCSNNDNMNQNENKINHKMDEEDDDNDSAATPTSIYSEDDFDEDHQKQKRQKRRQKPIHVKSRSSSRLNHTESSATTINSVNMNEQSLDDKLSKDNITKKNEDNNEKEIEKSMDTEMKINEHHEINNNNPSSSSSSPVILPKSISPINSSSPEYEDRDTMEIMEIASSMTTPKFCHRMINHLYGNNYFYCFLRLFEMIYSRLFKIKKKSEEMAKDPRCYSVNETAEQLGLISSRFEDVDISQGGYKALLDQIDRFFDSDIDAATFEENIRFLFKTDAYTIFNIDKLIQTIIKQIQTLATDEKSVDLLMLYQDNQRISNDFIYRPLSVYRTQAENLLGNNDHFFRISYNKKNHQLLIFLLDNDDEETPDEQENYEDYVQDFMNWKVAQNSKLSTTQPSILKRNLQISRHLLNDVIIDNKLHYMINHDDKHYRLSYKQNTEYLFYRQPMTATTASPSSPSISSKWEHSLSLKKKLDHHQGLEKMEVDAKQLLIGIK
ncbi:unnamed protein product [Cunninghamella blakesleeana]